MEQNTPGAAVDIRRRRAHTSHKVVIGAYYRRGSGGRVFQLVSVNTSDPARQFAATAMVRYISRKDGALAKLYAAEVGPRQLTPLEILSSAAG